MTLTALSRGEHLEPPPWLYARLARGSLMRLIYRRLIARPGGEPAPGNPPPGCGHRPRLSPGLSGPGPPRPQPLGPGFLSRHDPPGPVPAKGDGSPGSAPVAGGRRLPPAVPGRGFRARRRQLQLPHLALPGGRSQELRRVLAPGGRAWVYELRREATLRDLRAFARETGLPFFLVYLGYKIVSRHHALPESEFAHLLRQAAGPRGPCSRRTTSSGGPNSSRPERGKPGRLKGPAPAALTHLCRRQPPWSNAPCHPLIRSVIFKFS